MRYFARVTGGMEDLASGEIGQLPGFQLLEIAHRRIDFNYPGSPKDLLALRSVDDVYVYIGRLQPVDHTRAMLPEITQGIAGLDFTRAADICGLVRSIPPNPDYTITASLLGRRNYSRFEVAEVIHTGLAGNGWQYVENTPDHAPVDLDIRVLVEQDWLLVGVRLGAYPLHRRPYKQHSLPGSLKPPVAYCLCLLAEIRPGDVVLDPMCGAGTIPIEAAACGTENIFAADLNAEAVRQTRANAANAGDNLLVMNVDARNLPLPDQSVDRIVCNLPWGKQVADTAELPALYAHLLPEFARVLRPEGRAVLLTDREDLLLPMIDAAPELHLQAAHPISLYGSHPSVYVVGKK